MWQRATSGKPTRVVDDQVGRLTYTVDWARAVWGLVVGKREAGIGQWPSLLHAANSGQATRYDVAKYVFEAASVPNLLLPCTTADYPTAAIRPACSVLDTSRYEALARAPLPPWENAVDRFLTELRGEVEQ